jgi:hypothetical protein
MSELAQIPMLYAMYDFNADRTTYNLYAFPLATEWNNSGTLVQPDYLAYAAGMHRYWRGGIKYMIYFVTNSFTTARFRVSYIVDPLQDNLAGGGDFPSTVIEVKGSTIMKFTVPFLYQVPYRQTRPADVVPPDNGYIRSPKVQIECIALPVASQGSAPNVTAVIFRAGAEDTQFASLQSTIYDAEYALPPSEIVGQCSVQDTFKFKFDPISCNCSMAIEAGYTTTETTGKISDVMKRFAENGNLQLNIRQVWPVTTTGGTVPTGPGVLPGAQYTKQPYMLLTNLFKYQRGAIRYRFLNPMTTPVLENVIITPATLETADSGSGMTAWIRSHNPVHTIEVPWIGTVPYYPLTLALSIVNEQTMSVQNFAIDEELTVAAFQSFGDDRVLSYLMPPPLFVAYPTSTTTTTVTTSTMNTVTTTVVSVTPTKGEDSNSSKVSPSRPKKNTSLMQYILGTKKDF